MAAHHRPFGNDSFGKRAEGLARTFGTPKYILIQTLVVAIWIILNIVVLIGQWDPYPFILLNLAFSLQAAYAAPLILLAQTRQADRDKIESELSSKHRDEIAAEQATLLQANTDLTKEVAKLTAEIHEATLTKKQPVSSSKAKRRKPSSP